MKRKSSFSRSIVLAIAFVALVCVLNARRTAPHAVASPPTAPSVATASYPRYESEQAIAQALAYVRSKQQPDGGIDSFDLGGSNVGGTCRAVLALATAGYPIDWMTSSEGHTPIDYLKAQAVSYVYDSNQSPSSDYLLPQNAGLLLAAAAAANENLTSFGGVNLIDELAATYDSATGAYHSQAEGAFINGEPGLINQTWAIIGLSAAGEPIPSLAADYLETMLNESAGLGFDLDLAAFGIVALLHSGHVAPTDPSIQQALDSLYAHQLPNGGWKPPWDTAALNVNTTAWIIQALAAAGYTPAAESWFAGRGNPRAALLSVQNEDGSIGSGPYVNAYSTSEAVIGLVERPLTLLGKRARTHHALAWMGEQQNEDGSWNGFMGTPDVGTTIDALFAFAAAGYHTGMGSDSVYVSKNYLATNAAAYASQSPAAAGKLSLLAATMGEDPHNFGGVNILSQLMDFVYHTGAFSDTTSTYHQAYGILALAAADEPVFTTMITSLIALQQDDGGWKYDLTEAAWNTTAVDHTSLAIQALMAARDAITDTETMSQIDTSVARGVDFIRTMQDDQAGWGSTLYTASAIQGLLAAGEDLQGEAWRKNDHTPYTALASYQKPDGPFVGYAGDDMMSTSAAVLALMEHYHPFTSTLEGFTPVKRGADPDRMVAAMPYGIWNESRDAIEVVVPFGSDLNGDGGVSLEWQQANHSAWTGGITTTRRQGSYAATIPITDSQALKGYHLRATFRDPDGVQSDGEVSDSATRPGYVREQHARINPAATTVQTLTFTLDDGRWLNMIVPPGAVSEVTDVPFSAYKQGSPPVTATARMTFAGWAFELEAARDGEIVPDFAFAQPVTFTVHYRDSDVQEADETTLRLYYLNQTGAGDGGSGTWEDVATTCAPSSVYERDLSQNTLRVAVCHLSTYGLFSTEAEKTAVYLPMVMKP